MLPSLVTLDQLKDRTEVVDDTAAQAALDDASALVRLEAGMSWIDEDTGELEEVPDGIQAIVLGAVRRYLTNPEGYQSVQISQFSGRYSAADTAGGVVFLTDGEKKDIRKVVRGTLFYTVPLAVEGLLPKDKTLTEEDEPWILME